MTGLSRVQTMQLLLCSCFIISKQSTFIFQWSLSSKQRRGRQENRRALFTKYINMVTANSDVASKGTTILAGAISPSMTYCTHPTHNGEFFCVSQEPDKCKCCETVATVFFSSLSEKTRKSNRLQMSSQRKHFLLSYLKALNVGHPGIRTFDLPLNRPALSQLS